MNIVFYINKSDKRFLNKSLVEITTANDVVLLDENVNVINPHFRVNDIDFTNINYCYVPDFKRYYYIESTEIQYGGVVDVQCAVDVLMSFKSDIYNANGIVSRSNSMGNVLISDDMNVLRVDDTHTNLAFKGCEFLNTITSANYSFLLLTFGGTNSGV